MKRPDVHILSLGLRSGDGRLGYTHLRDGNLFGLEKTGILVRDGDIEYWPTDTELGWAKIYTRSDRTLYYDDFGEVTITQAERQLWSTDPFAVARVLHERFDCRDSIKEIIPKRLFKLGPTNLSIGRYPLRNIYFLANLEDKNDETLNALPKEDRAALVIIGYKWDEIELSEQQAKRTFLLEEVMEIDEWCVWKIRKELMDGRFGSPSAPAEHAPNPDWLRKVEKITQFYFRLCVDYIHDYPKLLEFRKQYATQGAVAKALGLTEQDLSRCVGKAAAKANEYPAANFWRRTFKDNDAYNEFYAFISEENPKISELEPEPTMKRIEGRTNRILVQALQREKAKR